MKNQINKLAEKYVSAERDLIEELMSLKNGGQDCNCSSDERKIIRTIHEGKFPEIVTRCKSCGGDVWERM